MNPTAIYRKLIVKEPFDVFTLTPGYDKIKKLEEFLKDTICSLYVENYVDRESFCHIKLKNESGFDFSDAAIDDIEITFSKDHSDDIYFIKFETNNSTEEKPEKIALRISKIFIDNLCVEYKKPNFEFATYDGFEPYLTKDSQYVVAKFVSKKNMYEVWENKGKCIKLYKPDDFNKKYTHLKAFQINK